MDKIRIYTVAQELGVPSKELLAYFEESGPSFASHLSAIDAETADRARAYFGVLGAGEAETVLAPAAAATQAGGVVLDFAPVQVEVQAKVEDERKISDELFVASQEAVLKVEQKVAAAAQAPVRQSLLTSAFATAAVAIVPTFAAFATLVFGQPHPRPFLAVLLSIVLTAGSIVVGSAIWATQPESAGFSFGDLMLWSWVRREAAERALIENTAILGFDRFGRFLGNSTASQEEQMRAVREIAAALDAKSSYTLGHSKRVEKHARKVAEVMGLSDEQIADLATAAALHDIGNIQIPDGVLRKTGELTIEERGAIEAHVLLGARMVLKAGNEDVVDGIRHHHERWDGAGYPDGEQGEEIPLFARIIGIAEAYDAMTSTRPYRQGFSREHAIQVLRSESSSQFDADIVEMFVSTLPEPLAVIARFPFLARIQRQLHELQLLFKRMGAIAVSATASTIAIALILGGTVLSPGTSDAPDLAERHRRVTPIDRVLASRLHNEASAYDASTPLSDALSPRGTTPATDVTGHAQEDPTQVASLEGEVKIPGGDGGQGEGPGSVDQPGPIGGGTVNPGPIVDQPGPSGAGGSHGGGSNVGGGNIGRGESPGNTGGGSVNPGPVVDQPSGGTVNPGPSGGTVNPGPVVTTPPAASDDDSRPGNSGNAPGHNKDDDGAPGNSGNAPGHNKDDDGAPGNSGNAPGQNKDDDAAPGNSGNAPGQDKGSDEAPGNSGNAGGGSSNAGGNSDNAGGNGGGNGNAGVGAGAGAAAAPGNSGNAPGQDKDKGRDEAPSASVTPASSNGNGK